jgi:hypothetical protein
MYVWDGPGKLLSRPVITCGAVPVVIGGTGAATMQCLIFVLDKAYTQVQQCQRGTPPPSGPTPVSVSGGRFACKASGNIWATLTIKPQLATRTLHPLQLGLRRAAGHAYDFAVNRTLMSTFPIPVAGSCDVTPAQV